MVQLLGTTNSKSSRPLASRQFQLLVGTGLLLIGLSSLVAWPALPLAAK